MPAKQLTDTEARQYLADNDTGRLATCSPDGHPYIVPINYIFHKESIYFHCAHEGKKLDNLKATPQVCFEVSHTDKLYFADKPCNCGTRYTSVLAFGTANIVADEAEKIDVLNTLTARFAKGRPYSYIDGKLAACCSVVRIKISELSGKKNVDPDQV